MSSKTLALSSPKLLAEYVRESELKSFFEKRLASPPDHMAMLIRNGEIIDTYKGAHFSIGGVFSKLKSIVVGSHHISILLADLKPFSVQTPFKAITKDKVPVACVCTLELQINPDEPQNVMGLVNSSGYLTHNEVMSRFRPHLTDRVVESAVSRVNANELRGERGMQDHLQAEIMREVERVAGDLGLHVRAVSMEWALNDVEIESMEQAVLDREQEKLNHELKLLKQNIQRNSDATSFQLEIDVDMEKLKSASEEELELMVLNREVRLLDARVQTQRQQELDALAHEIEVLRGERLGKFENRLAEADHLVDAAQRQLNLTKVNREIDLLEKTHLIEMKKLGAFSDLEIRERTEDLNLRIRERTQEQNAKHIARMSEIEQAAEAREAKRQNEGKQVDANIEIGKTKAESDARVNEYNAAAILTPEQIMAVNAGLSPDVANVLVEQARAAGSNNEQVMALMREMVTQATEARVSSENQARDMFRMGMEGAMGVASGTGSVKTEAKSPVVTKTETTECSKCGRNNDLRSRCCKGCGHQLRN